MSTRVRLAAILVIAASVLALTVVRVIASHQFTDVPDANPYHADVDWAKDRNITGGCGGSNYCPNSYVTRGQMAAFLHRQGNVAAPATLNIEGAVDALDLDNSSSRPVVCTGVDPITPTYPLTAYFDGRVSIVPAAAAPNVGVWAWPAYSTDGGTTWTRMEPDTPPSAQGAGAGLDFSVPLVGFANLDPGNTYDFGIVLWDSDEGSTGDGTADTASGGRCGMYAMIFNRNDAP